MTRRLAHIGIDLAAMLALLTVSVLGFGPSFGGTAYLVAGLGGLVLGLAIALAGYRLRWGVIVTTGVTLGAYLLFGSALVLRSEAIAGVIPTVDTLRQLALGVVYSWKQLLTIEAPVAGFDSLLIVPYLSTLVAAVLAGSWALRLTRPALALVPAAALLVLAISFGTYQPAAPVLQGVVFAGVAIAWVAFRRRVAQSTASLETSADDGDDDVASVRQLWVRRLLLGGGIVAVACIVAGLVSTPLTPTATREVLRDAIIPPLDLRSYASPLTSFRKFVKDDDTTTLFTVDGLPAGTRIRLATMDLYDGIVYNVAGDGSGGSGTFSKVGSTITNDTVGTDATITVTIDDLSGVWVPDAGYLRSLSFTGARASQLGASLHYNKSTGVAVATSGLRAGDTYTADLVVPAPVTREELAGRAVSTMTMPASAMVPDVVATKATSITSTASTPLEQLELIEAELKKGYFSSGLEGSVPSLSGHGYARINAFLDPAQAPLGDDEQYAVTMALMAIQLGIPARVVMGFYPDAATVTPGELAVTGTDVHAWVEVPFDGAGWVAFDPTPPEDNVQVDQDPVPQSKPKAQVLQPPPPPEEPAEVPPDARTEERTDDVDEPLPGWIGTALAIAGGTLGVAAILVGPALLIGLLKSRRRGRRLRSPFPAQRISGGWDEIVDRATDLGVVVPRGGTRREGASVVDGAHPQAGVLAVADRADTGVFGPGEPSDAEIVAFWAEVDRIAQAMNGSVGVWRRLRARVSLRSFATQWSTQLRARIARRKENS